MIDISGVWATLPHRYPMLLVDRVVELVPGESIVARKAVSGNEPWFAGNRRYTGYPSVLLVESWCQAGGLLVGAGGTEFGSFDGHVALFGSMTDVEFGMVVRPGDVLEHRVRLVRVSEESAVLEGETRVRDDTVLTVGSVIVARRPAGLVRPSAG